MKYLLLICLIALSCTLYAQVVDLDGYTYKTVTIGEQEWFAENLRTSKYNDGVPIPIVADDNAWSHLSTGLYCYFDNNAANNATYGKLYNWYAVETDKLCPMGWHVPTDDEWRTLLKYLGGRRIAGKKMKNTSGWSDNGNGTNLSGFSGLPGGYRSKLGYFPPDFIGEMGCWWSSTEDGKGNAYSRLLGQNGDNLKRSDYGGKHPGYSVRCLKD